MRMAVERFRPLRRSDCDALASYCNRNRLEPDPIWCAKESDVSGTTIWLHRLVLAARGRGRAISQVHEIEGRPVSYFGGYWRGRRAAFSIGIVDVDLADPMETWRQDVSHLFAATLADHVETFHVQSSSDRGRFVGWLEDEVGAVRLAGRNAWTADRARIAAYVGRPELVEADRSAARGGLGLSLAMEGVRASN